MGKIELTVRIDDDLAAQASQEGSIDTVVENALRAYVDASKASSADARAKKWAEENAEAIKAYNERIARRGLFGEDQRRW